MGAVTDAELATVRAALHAASASCVIGDRWTRVSLVAWHVNRGAGPRLGDEQVRHRLDALVGAGVAERTRTDSGAVHFRPVDPAG